MPLLKEKDRKFLKDEFEKNLKNEVKLVIFTSDEDCQILHPNSSDCSRVK